MRISSSNVTLASSQIHISSATVQEHLRMWDRDSELNYSSEKKEGAVIAESMVKRDSIQITRPDPRSAPKKVPGSPSQQRADLKQKINEEFVGDIKIQIIKDIIEMFTGRKIEVLNPDELKNGEPAETPLPAEPAGGDQAPDREGWGIDYQYRETHYVKEGVAFSAAGTVTTADGRAIDFSAALEMSRETYEEVNISLKAGDALKDPLVIDLAGAGAGFSTVKFEFDIDSDGQNERLNAPRAGTGLLAYDKNGNGIIDNGSELFGPESGNGFSELALLDDDNNGWIDENDSAFSSLRVWEKGSDGSDLVSSLLARGVGALYTGSAKTDYSLTAGSELAGVLRESGVFLRENGGAGVIQEVDLVV